MSPYQFTNVLVAIDGSRAPTRRSTAPSRSPRPSARPLTALAVEGRLPAYAASLGEVDEVKREKDAFYDGVLEPLPNAARRAASRSRRRS